MTAFWTIVFVLLVAACYAQVSEPGDRRYPIVELALTIPANSSDDCFRLDREPHAIAMFLYTNYTVNSCLNMASIFSPSQRDGKSDSSCNPNSSSNNCTNDYEVSAISNYSPEANYSRIRFQITPPLLFPGGSDPDADLSNFTMRVFAGEDCIEDATQPWFSWGGCTEGQGYTCNELPYSVGSIRLEQTAEVERGDCKIAAERGAGVKGKEASLAAIVVGLIATGLLVMYG